MSYSFYRVFIGVVISVVLSFFVVSCSKSTGDSQTEQNDQQKGEEADELPEGLTPEQAAKVVAKVGDRVITVGDVTRQINRLSPYIRRRWAAPEKRKEFLEKLIRVELLSQEAERIGLSNDPEVQRTVNQVMIRLMIKNELEKELFPSEVDEQTLKADYEKEKDKYHRAPQVRASHIVLASKPAAEKLLADLKKHVTDTRYFRQKAREVSVDETTKDRGGDLGYFSKPEDRRDDEPEVPAKVAEAVWQLQNIGDMSDKVVESKQGFHIVKLTNKRPEMNRSFESVKRMIENRMLRELRRDAMDKFVDGLRSNAKIEVFKDNLAKLNVNTDIQSGMPGQMPPGARLPPGPTPGPIPPQPAPSGNN